jgi:hypothetical protein
MLSYNKNAVFSTTDSKKFLDTLSYQVSDHKIDLYIEKGETIYTTYEVENTIGIVLNIPSIIAGSLSIPTLIAKKFLQALIYNSLIFIFSTYLIIYGILILTGKKIINLENHLFKKYITIKNKNRFIKLIGYIDFCMGTIFLILDIALIYKNDCLMYITLFLLIVIPLILLCIFIILIRFK